MNKKDLKNWNHNEKRGKRGSLEPLFCLPILSIYRKTVEQYKELHGHFLPESINNLFQPVCLFQVIKL